MAYAATAWNTSAERAEYFGEPATGDDCFVWTGIEITTQADGGGVTLDAYKAGLEPDDFPMGRPGIALRFGSPEEARALAAALTAAADEVEASNG